MRPRSALGAAALVLAACVGTAGGTGAPASPRASHPAAPVTLPAVPPSAEPSGTPSPDPGRHGFELRPAPWAPALDAIIGDAPMSVSVAIGGRLRFSHRGALRRPPASNEKLLLSMALLDAFGPRARIPTTLELDGSLRNATVRGDVWIVGHGDPEVDGATIGRLATELASDGVAHISGSVVGDTSAFRRDRWAPGWHRIALSYISVPTALTYDANADANGFVFDPERRAATALTADLEAEGIDVTGPPRTGAVPGGVRTLERVRSAPLVRILRRQNTSSVNLDAEVLGKWLGSAETDRRGSIASGAAAIEAWAADHGATIVARDASGLSYANRVSTDDMVRLLSISEDERWGAALRSSLPGPGAGTLAGRLLGLRLAAKTGTLIDGVSALSGWVRRRSGGWAAFSILSEGMSKDGAVALEDSVVRFLAERA